MRYSTCGCVRVSAINQLRFISIAKEGGEVCTRWGMFSKICIIEGKSICTVGNRQQLALNNPHWLPYFWDGYVNGCTFKDDNLLPVYWHTVNTMFGKAFSRSNNYIQAWAGQIQFKSIKVLVIMLDWSHIILTCSWVSQLSANHKCILVIPPTVTYTTPHCIHTHFYCSFLWYETINQPDCTMGTWYMCQR